MGWRRKSRVVEGGVNSVAVLSWLRHGDGSLWEWIDALARGDEEQTQAFYEERELLRSAGFDHATIPLSEARRLNEAAATSERV